MQSSTHAWEPDVTLVVQSTLDIASRSPLCRTKCNRMVQLLGSLLFPRPLERDLTHGILRLAELL